MSDAYQIVRTFEGAVARHVNAKHGIAVDNCTNALFLSMKYIGVAGLDIKCPAQTFLSVPMAISHAGARPRFYDLHWEGQYPLLIAGSSLVWDSAQQLEPKSYKGGLMCVSFHYKKPLPIGKGGMILTDSDRAAEWLRRARYIGREEYPFPYPLENVTMLGWNMTMTPEQAARGFTLLELARRPQIGDYSLYPDLRACPLWKA